MSYIKQQWVPYDENKTENDNIKNGAVGTADRMNYIESGIERIDKKVTGINGGPAGYFETESELIESYPNGDSHFYIVKGYMYWWTGIKWTNGGLYQAVGIADKSVTPEKIFGGSSTGEVLNLLNPLTISMGQYIDGVGTAANTNVGGVYCTDYIPIKPGTKYTFITMLDSPGGWYDANKKFVSTFIKGPKTQTAPVNAGFMRWNGDKNTPADTTKIVEGDDYNVGGTITGEYTIDWLRIPEKNIIKSTNNELSIVTLGDSVTWYDGQTYLSSTNEAGKKVKGYQYYLRKELNATVTNHGVSGYTTKQILDNLRTKTFDKTDVITLFSGINDFRDHSKNTFGVVSDVKGNFDENTFCGAYQATVEYICKNYPENKLLLIIPFKTWTTTSGLMPADYRDAIIKIALLYGIPYCNLYDQARFNEITFPKMIADTSAVNFKFHPSTIGYKEISDVIVPFIKNNTIC